MALTLKKVPARQGAVWVRDGFRTFWRSPLAFTGIYAVLLLIGVPLSQVPWIGPLLAFAALPLMTVGYMIASRQVLQGSRVHPRQLVEPLAAGAPHRGRFLALCVAYALAAAVVFVIGDWADGGSLQQLTLLMNDQRTEPAQVEALVLESALLPGMLLRIGLIALLSVPFWHAPALVHWGSQGVAQSLFSSTLAIWRNRGAFFVYGVVWSMIGFGVGLVLSLVLALLGLAGGPGTGMLATPLLLMLTAAFYVSLLFTFNDSFGANGAPMH